MYNLGNLHSDINEYTKALDEYEEALKIRRKLAEENPKTYLPDVANTLLNLGNLHFNINEYTKALDEYEEALIIRRKLAEENPKAYLSDLAMTLNNLSILCQQAKDYSKSIYYLNTLNDLLHKYKDPIYYKPQLAQNYGSLSWWYLFTKEYSKSEQSARQALKLNSASIAKTNLAHALLFQNRFSEAEAVYKELSQTIEDSNETYSQILLDGLNELGKANVIPAERKADVEKIKGLLQKEKQKAKR